MKTPARRARPAGARGKRHRCTPCTLALQHHFAPGWPRSAVSPPGNIYSFSGGMGAPVPPSSGLFQSEPGQEEGGRHPGVSSPAARQLCHHRPGRADSPGLLRLHPRISVLGIQSSCHTRRFLFSWTLREGRAESWVQNTGPVTGSVPRPPAGPSWRGQPGPVWERPPSPEVLGCTAGSLIRLALPVC